MLPQGCENPLSLTMDRPWLARRGTNANTTNKCRPGAHRAPINILGIDYHQYCSSSPSMGLGQGNGAALPGFLDVCTLMINVYCNLGHGVTFIGAWVWDAFTLSAVLYMDDPDIFHMALGTTFDEEILADSSECNQ
jgi:hypothetical protein